MHTYKAIWRWNFIYRHYFSHRLFSWRASSRWWRKPDYSYQVTGNFLTCTDMVEPRHGLEAAISQWQCPRPLGRPGRTSLLEQNVSLLWRNFNLVCKKVERLNAFFLLVLNNRKVDIFKRKKTIQKRGWFYVLYTSWNAVMYHIGFLV